jgi:hypothetical protein
MKKAVFWAIAVVITICAVFYQRITGPTYPLRGKIMVGETEVKYRLPRSHESTNDCRIAVKAENPEISGHLLYQRFKTDDPWTNVPLSREGDSLVASLPKQPLAGKLAYKVTLASGETKVSLSGDSPVIIRFRGAVPAFLIIIHALLMFLGMLLSNMAGLTALDGKRNPRNYALWTLGFLIVGGLILGSIVQKMSFGAFWTGIPFGTDLTDNKTLIALVAWVVAVVAGRKGKPARGWVLAAALIVLVVYSIPHSLLGSELEYSKMG